MANFVRKNAWTANNGGQFTNSDGSYTDLYWYAKGVGVMMSRQLSDPTSWWFYAAIHGQYIVDNDGSGPPPTGYPNWANIPGPPAVPTSPLPTASLISQYWNQCQHAGWFFPPWHRGYLYALENILRGIIIGLDGPDSWALPYWNYLKQGTNQYQLPPAFAALTLPDNSPNPLYVNARYGPNGNGNIYVPIPPVSQRCQQATTYTNQYGGGKTGFDHFDSSTGLLEQNPHNLVHGYVGGQSTTAGIGGLMGDPGLAALDPIFYLHHGNIDRLWAAWNASSNNNPTDPTWLNGPTASADRKFYMPNPDGSAWQYTPAMVNTVSQLNYTYDDISAVAPALVTKNTMRLRKLGAPINEVTKASQMENNETPELIGASTTPLKLGASGVNAAVKLDSTGLGKVRNSLLKAVDNEQPDEVYLQLEGVKGTEDSQIYTVAVNHHYAGHVSLFGLRIASAKNSHHAGAGLTIKLDISTIVDELHLNDELTDSLDVVIQPVGSNINDNTCTIDRISIYKVKK
jgi:tyrosinase